MVWFDTVNRYRELLFPFFFLPQKGAFFTLHSSIQHLPTTCMAPGPVLGTGDTANGHDLCLRELTVG